jgi:hypothetical protein
MRNRISATPTNPLQQSMIDEAVAFVRTELAMKLGERGSVVADGEAALGTYSPSCPISSWSGGGPVRRREVLDGRIHESEREAT